MTTITVRVGQKPTKEQIKRIKAAAKAPIKYTADCPESTPEALAEFAAKARELRQKKKLIKPAVKIRVNPVSLSKYKSLGSEYISIMANVLDYAVDNPEILAKARG